MLERTALLASTRDQEVRRMLESKAIIGDSDMLQTMQQDALRLAGKALDEFDITDSTEIAHFIKKVSSS